MHYPYRYPVMMMVPADNGQVVAVERMERTEAEWWKKLQSKRSESRVDCKEFKQQDKESSLLNQ